MIRRAVFIAIAATAVSAACTAQDAVDALHYRAVIEFDPGTQTITATADISLRNPSPRALDSVTLDLRDLTVRSVTIGGTAAAFSQAQGGLTMRLPAPLAPGDSIIASVAYGGHPTSEAGASSWGGCFWTGSCIFSMGVGFTAPYVSMTRHWLPSHDVPSDKATFDLTFIVPDGSAAAGAGRLAEETHSGGKASYRWIEDHQTATYLVTYAIADYVRVQDRWNAVPLEYWVPAQEASWAVLHFTRTVSDALDAFTSLYGPYPFDKVGYCITPIGSMEHQTMISYAQGLYDANPGGSTVVHELAHMWWGDWVTPMDFREAWLSEGFATFNEAVYDEHLQGRDAFLAAIHAFQSEYRNSIVYAEGSFPLYDFPRAAPSSNYPMTIYRKGAAVLAMLRDVVGDSAFFQALRSYGALHAYGNATTEDLRTAMEHASGQSLDWFFTEWVYRAGFPSYIVQRVYEKPSGAFRIRLVQTQDTTKTPLFRMPVSILLVTPSGDTIRRRITSPAVKTEDVSFSDVPSDSVRSYIFDPENLILKNVMYRTTGTSPVPAPAQGSVLESIYPSPLRAGTDEAIVPFRVPDRCRVRIDLYDSLGRTVATLADAEFDPGRHVVRLHAGGFAAGAYAIQLHSATGTSVRPITIVR